MKRTCLNGTRSLSLSETFGIEIGTILSLSNYTLCTWDISPPSSASLSNFTLCTWRIPILPPPPPARNDQKLRKVFRFSMAALRTLTEIVVLFSSASCTFYVEVLSGVCARCTKWSTIAVRSINAGHSSNLPSRVTPEIDVVPLDEEVMRARIDHISVTKLHMALLYRHIFICNFSQYMKIVYNKHITKRKQI